MAELAPSALLTTELVTGLPPEARAVLPYLAEVWLRPEQRAEVDGLRELGFLGGRGWGKTFAAANAIYQIVRRDGPIHFGVMAPTEEVAKSVPFQALIEASPIWDRPEQRGDRLIWPNGSTARLFTAREGGLTRGQNYHLFWFTELVMFPAKTMVDTWAVAAATTRKGLSLLIWDSTSRGTHALIAEREKAARRNPDECRIIRGSSFQNPQLPIKFLRDLCASFDGQRLREEAFGETFDREAGALWGAEEIAERRVAARDVPALAIKLLAHDPALSDRDEADETGLVGGGIASDGTVYILRDDSGRIRDWGETIADAHQYDGYAGAVSETNRGGDMALQVLNAICGARKIRLAVLKPHEAFKPWMREVLQLKLLNTTRSKLTRGEGARAYGNVRHAGTFAELEHELTTYDGTGKSPNRFDAFGYLVAELAGLKREAKAPPAPQNGYGTLVSAMRGTGARRAI